MQKLEAIPSRSAKVRIQVNVEKPRAQCLLPCRSHEDRRMPSLGLISFILGALLLQKEMKIILTINSVDFKML